MTLTFGRTNIDKGTRLFNYNNKDNAAVLHEHLTIIPSRHFISYCNFFSSLEVFPEFHQIPFSKMLTFYRKENFSLEAKYSIPNMVPIKDPFIGMYSRTSIARTLIARLLFLTRTSSWVPMIPYMRLL